MVGATATAAIRAASELAGETFTAKPLSCTAWPVAVDLMMAVLHVPVLPLLPEAYPYLAFVVRLFREA